MPNKELIDIAAQVRHETEKAWLLFDGTSESWVPKSQVENNGDGTFTMPLWLAEKNGYTTTKPKPTSAGATGGSNPPYLYSWQSQLNKISGAMAISSNRNPVTASQLKEWAATLRQLATEFENETR